MIEDHDAIRALVAEYDLTRLTPEERRAVEEHLAGCPTCPELREHVRLLREQIRVGGEAMFEPHPEPAALRGYARGQGGPESRVGRHILLCSVCRLEVEAWRRPGEERGPAPGPGAGAMWVRLGLATAAAALIGLVAGWRFHASVASRTATLPPPSPASSSDARAGAGAPPGQEMTLASRAPVLHLLPGIPRGGEPPRQRWVLASDESSVGVAVPMSVPVSATGTDRFRFEIGLPGGEPVWSQELTAGKIREHLDAAEVVNLIVIPKQPLRAGEYEFRVLPSPPSAGAPIYLARIEVAYRQSPAATNPPQ